MTALLLLLCILLFSSVDLLAVKWAANGSLLFFCLCVLLGPTAYLLFGHLGAQGSLGKIGGYVNAGVVLATVAAGMIFLRERPDHLSWLGIGLIVSGIAVLNFGKVATAA